MTGQGAATITLEGVSKRFGATVAVDSLTAHLPPGSLTALLGPSGCGKTTLLSLIAGLQTPDSGVVRFDDVPVTHVPAERRPAGLVFQKPLLFPHLTVEQNVGFGLRMRHRPKSEIRQRVGEMLDRVHLPGLSQRRIGELSGGQEQRVALARALVLQPRILLLDEPFSQLDAQLRGQMRALLRQLHDESAITTIFVTHDQLEAVDVADTIALMLGGRLAGHAPPETFYTRPPTLEAARFFGATNEIAGRVTAGTFTSQDGALIISTSVPDGPATLVIRPEALTLTTTQHPGCPAFVITGARHAGTHWALTVRTTAGTTLRVHTPLGASADPGSAVFLTAAPDRCTILPGSP